MLEYAGQLLVVVHADTSVTNAINTSANMATGITASVLLSMLANM